MEKLKGQLESYKEQPFSLVLRLLMWIATFLTVGITVCIVGYILIRGIPTFHRRCLPGNIIQRMYP